MTTRLGLVLALGLLAATAAGDDLTDLCREWSGHDANGDGEIEIEWLEAIDDPPAAGRLLVILIEDRLLDPSGDDPGTALLPALRTWVADLESEGWRPRLVRARVHRGPRHQDGRTLLAIRAFFRRVRDVDATFAGAVLVGSFPEAFLVRSCNWRRFDKPLVLFAGKPDEKRFDEGAHNLRTVPEDVAHRAEIVLSDLDGRWDELYHEPRQRLPRSVGVYPGGVPPRGGVTTDFDRGWVTYEDFFLVDDGRLHVGEILGPGGDVAALDLVPLDDHADRECSTEDLARPNRIARPDVVVSRIDARGIALSPDPRLVDESGLGLLDDEGRPRAVRFAEGAKVPHWANEVWVADPALERRLLVEYFARNHAHRTRPAGASHRPASIACDLGSGYDVLLGAAPAWRDLPRDGFDVGNAATLLDLVEWLERPAVLRTIRAHSNRWGSAFRPADLARLEAAAGGVPWCWSPRGRELVPSLEAASRGGFAEFFLWRTMWANDALSREPAFYLHTGCEAISPPRAHDRPYHDPEYARRQGAEAVLFYGRGLALVGRAKVFYDEPRGFAEALGEGRTFGEAWARYFEIESSAGSWAEVGGDIGRKRAYFWSVLGDWTLRLTPPAAVDRQGG